MDINKELEKRALPPILTEVDWETRRKELLDILSENVFGITPEAPKAVTATELGRDRWKTFGGKATAVKYRISFDTPNGEYGFPITVIRPTKEDKPAVILHINFKGYPVPEEEIIDRGYCLVEVTYTDITPDSIFGDFTEGLAGKFIGYRNRRIREATEPGLVSLWAYGCSRIMDYLVTRDDIDTKRVAVCGHSRLGKTALWTKAQDPRFFVAMGNNSNYGGAGVVRGHKGEDVNLFLDYGSYNFFCERFKSFENVPHEDLPFDFHFMLALQAPGYVYVTGATEDSGMDPLSEFVSCYAAGEVYRFLGKTGLVTDGNMPEAGTALLDGEIGFSVREGGHFMSREDWNNFMDFFDMKKGALGKASVNLEV